MSLFVTEIEEFVKDNLNKRIAAAVNQDDPAFHNNYTFVNTSAWLHKKQSFVRLVSNAQIVDGNIPYYLASNQTIDEAGRSDPFSDPYAAHNIGDFAVDITTKQADAGIPGFSGNGPSPDTSNIPKYNQNLRKQWILTGGTVAYGTKDSIRMGYSQLYSNIRNLPFPGITGISVTNKNAFGSVREATIKYICYGVEQLEIMEMLYMTPGISCFLEWGWSLDIDGNPINIITNLDDEATSMDSKMITQIKKNTKAAGGHYDAMKGLICNFNWTQREDGAYDCSTTISSMADTFLSMDIKSSSLGLKGRVMDDLSGKETTNAPVTNIQSIIEMFKDRLNVNGVDIIYDTLKPNGNDKIPIGFNTQIKIEKPWVERSIAPSRKEKYITWGTIEDYLITACLGFTNDQNDTDDFKDNMAKTLSNDSTDAFEGAIPTADEILKLFPRINSYGLKIFNDEFLKSADPLVCILPGQEAITEDYVTYSTGIEGASSAIEVKLSYGKASGMTPFKFNKTSGYIRNIAVNLDFIEHTYKNLSTSTLDAFLMALLNAISDACGEAWKFSLFVNENNPTAISIIDLNQKKEPEKENPVPIKLSSYGNNSIIRNVSITTEVDANMKGHIIFGSNQDKGAKDISSRGTMGYQFYGRQITDMGYNKIKTSNLAMTIHENVEQLDLSVKGLKETVTNAISEVTNERTESSVAKAKQAMNNYLVHTYRGTFEDKNNINMVILPVKLSFTLDGISGLKWGNSISIEPLPSRYDKTISFTITNLTHNINGNDWTTEVETCLRFQLSQDYKDVSPGLAPPKSASLIYQPGSSTNNAFTVVAADNLKGKFVSPTIGKVVSGVMQNRSVNGAVSPHKGVDIANTIGTPINASYNGTVIAIVRNHPTAGNFIDISHSIDGATYISRYLHLSAILVKQGMQVTTSQNIGEMGIGGTGSHLHFEIRKEFEGGPVIDPISIIPNIGSV